MKKMRKLVPAFAMLMVAAIMMSTASFAWFSMNETASATGMSVQAKASAGILISNGPTSAGGNAEWASSATAANNTTAELMPVSTLKGTAWYTTTSNNAGEVQANQAKTDYTNVTGNPTGYYLKNSFYIKSSSNEALANDINISSISVSNGNKNYALNDSLRVLVVCGNTHYIYSPAARTYSVLTTARTPGNDADNTTVNTFTEISSIAAGTNKSDALGVDEIPNVAATATGDSGTTKAVQIDVYVYFEGEDAACMSANLADGVATLSVEITFSLGASTAPSAPAEDPEET